MIIWCQAHLTAHLFYLWIDILKIVDRWPILSTLLYFQNEFCVWNWKVIRKYF